MYIMENKKNSKTVLTKLETMTYDAQTGEVFTEQTLTKRKVSKEPDFIKLYLNDVMLLSDVPKSKSDILYLLLRKMNYDNEITVVASHKRDIANELKCSQINIDKTLSLLVEKGILIRKERGVYVANPRLFGKGNWEDIEELRMSIDYKKSGIKRIGTVISKDDHFSLSKQETKQLMDRNNDEKEESSDS